MGKDDDTETQENLVKMLKHWPHVIYTRML